MLITHPCNKISPNHQLQVSDGFLSTDLPPHPSPTFRDFPQPRRFNRRERRPATNPVPCLDADDEELVGVDHHKEAGGLTVRGAR